MLVGFRSILWFAVWDVKHVIFVFGAWDAIHACYVLACHVDLLDVGEKVVILTLCFWSSAGRCILLKFSS
jgi:hypothetical protein